MYALSGFFRPFVYFFPFFCSFGLTVIPYLTYNYNQVHYYDARYYDHSAVGYTVAEMVEKYNIHDIYFIIADFHTFDSGFLMTNANFHLNMQ